MIICAGFGVVSGRSYPLSPIGEREREREERER